MRLVIALLVTFAIAVALIAFSQTPDCRITFFDTTYYGGVKNSVEDSFVKHTFRFKNTGTKTVFIDDIISTCGCTVVNSSDKKIEPGKEGEIEINLSLSTLGKTEKQVVVLSNSITSPDILSISGEYRPKVYIESIPKVLKLDDISMHNKQPNIVTICIMDDKDRVVNINEYKSVLDFDINVKSIKKMKNRSLYGYYITKYEVQITPNKDLPETFTDTLSLAFDSPDIPSFNLPITGD